MFNKSGVLVDPDKIRAIKNAEAPTNSVFRLIPNYSTIVEPNAESLQRILHGYVMAYINDEHQTELVVDTSPVRLGEMLCKGNNEHYDPKVVVAYASRGLTDIERRDRQTEREALAIVWSSKHFRLYVYRSDFKLISDYKPLELIFNNPSSKLPARIERNALRLQQYRYNVFYKHGRLNPSDFMSRHPTNGCE